MQHITVGAPSKSVAVRNPPARPEAEPSASPSPLHPLDGLSPAELRIATAAVKKYAAKLGVAPVRFNSVHIVVRMRRCQRRRIRPAHQTLCSPAGTCARCPSGLRSPC